MSKNAANKRRARARHRDQWSAAPRGTDLAFFVRDLVPTETPLLKLAAELAEKSRQQRDDMWRLFREKYANG